MSGMEWIPAVAASAISAGGSAYSANQANNAAAGNAYMSNMTNMFMQAQNQGYNSAEASKLREFNAQQAGITRNWAEQQRLDTQTYNHDEAGIARQFNKEQQDNAQLFNSEEAKRNREYQSGMANTAYQRAIADMKAAGLNPMLAYSQGGAATPSGSSASSSASSGPTASSSSGGGAQASGGQASSGGWAGATTPSVMPIPVGSVMSSALDLGQKAAQIRRTDAETKQIETATTGQATENQYTSHVLNDRIRGFQLDVSNKNISNRMNVELEDVRKDIANIELAQRKQDISESKATEAYKRIAARLSELGVPEAEASAEFYKRFGMTDKVLNTIGQGVGSAVGIGRLGAILNSGKQTSKGYNRTYYDRDGNISGGMSHNYGD